MLHFARAARRKILYFARAARRKNLNDKKRFLAKKIWAWAQNSLATFLFVSEKFVYLFFVFRKSSFVHISSAAPQCWQKSRHSAGRSPMGLLTNKCKNPFRPSLIRGKSKKYQKRLKIEGKRSKNV